ncbi:arsenate reductase [Arcobacter nitrofigilis DSM 7299]|uniref:Arsenate reductase n=1 Tax=Arcobacter nitrofigilis (strain ATCC 33309 / DSM 7299 / CCUG 15893 / LMG 7604 / NCTC 12251 / CI) TaxID=572480 RepID=D5V206_ARCNC|nr:arsenate reductase (glutaredoxin) [Arcobacter nitrofigilis]ADG93590.1 arsenate reductase [Arcobacter nitrofigilis DSM 7299]
MEEITIWHNPRCSKSRDALNHLQEKKIALGVIKYLDAKLTKEDMKEVLQMLNMSARELMRTKEDIYKELNLKDENDEEKLIEAMINNPKLIERPIIIKDGRAVIARPLEKINELF